MHSSAYECHRKGIRFLPLCAIAYLAFVTMAAAPFVDDAALLAAILLTALLFIVTAFCVGYGMGKPSFWGDMGFTSWDASKPVSSGFIALAKIRAAAATSLLTWTLLFLAIPVWLWVLRIHGDLPTTWKPISGDIWQVCTLCLIAFLAFFTITWGQMIGGLCLSLTSRGWIVNGVAAFSIVLALAFFFSWRHFGSEPSTAHPLRTFWTWVAGALVGTKFAGAAWFLWSGHRRGLVLYKEIAPSIVLWCLGTSNLIMAVNLILPALWKTTGFGHLYLSPSSPPLATLIAILAVPLLRLAAAPHAVAWSRHG